MDELVKHSYVSVLPSHAFTFGFGFLPSLFFCFFLLTCFHSSPCVCHFRLLPNGIPLVNPCQLRSRYDKIKAPQILHGRNTLQKYVGNRELTKTTQKVLKIKEY